MVSEEYKEGFVEEVFGAKPLDEFLNKSVCVAEGVEIFVGGIVGIGEVVGLPTGRAVPRMMVDVRCKGGEGRSICFLVRFNPAQKGSN